MCVIFFYVCSNPAPGGYKLILASNRDEFYGRNTKDASQWSSAPHVYGGIDLEPGREGGTWLAIGGQNGIFKIGALLNLTGEPKPKNAVGRGMIVSDYVSSMKEDDNLENYNKHLLADCEKYSAFNFVSIEIGASSVPAKISICSNAPSNMTHFDEGKCYGFGNSLHNAPFQKVLYGQQKFEEIIKKFIENSKTIETAEQTEIDLIMDLQNLLKNPQQFWPDAELERRAPKWGQYLSSLNVNVPQAGYGSRTHTVILVDDNNKMHFYEETMTGLDPQGEWRKTHLTKEFFKN